MPPGWEPSEAGPLAWARVSPAPACLCGMGGPWTRGHGFPSPGWRLNPQLLPEGQVGRQDADDVSREEGAGVQPLATPVPAASPVPMEFPAGFQGGGFAGAGLGEKGGQGGAGGGPGGRGHGRSHRGICEFWSRPRRGCSTTWTWHSGSSQPPRQVRILPTESMRRPGLRRDLRPELAASPASDLAHCSRESRGSGGGPGAQEVQWGGRLRAETTSSRVSHSTASHLAP